MGRARPTAVGRKARRRSSTSATKTVREHDRSDRLNPDLPSRCSLARIPPGGRGPLSQSASGTFRSRTKPLRCVDRSPTEVEPQSTPDRPRRMRYRVGSPSSSERSRACRGQRDARAPACARGAIPAEVSRARGRMGVSPPAPSAAIARDGSFAPTRSARTPAVVKLATMPAGEAGAVGRARGGCAPIDEPTGQTCLREARRMTRLRGVTPPVQDELVKPAWKGGRFRSHHRRQGRFPRFSAKRTAIGCTRGAFHR